MLERIQRDFPDMVNDTKWHSVRNDILNLSNDIIRANKDDFDAFESSYKVYPFVISYDAKGHKTMSLSYAALTVFQGIRFVGSPCELIISVKANDYNIEVIKHILKMFVFGKIEYKNGFISYTVLQNDCIKITPLLNIIPFRPNLKKQYDEWKKDLFDWFKKNGDW